MNEIRNKLAEVLKEEELEATYQEAIERKRMLKDLLEHPGFQVYQERLRKQIEIRFSQMVDFPSGLDSCIQANYTLGEIAGMKLALGWAGLLMEAADSVILMQKARDQEREESVDEEDKL